MRFVSALALGALSVSTFGCNGPATFTGADMLATYEIEAAIPTTLYAAYNSGAPARNELTKDYAEIAGAPLAADSLALSYDSATDYLRIDSVEAGVPSVMAIVPGYKVLAENADGDVARFSPSLTDLVSVKFDVQFGETQTSLSVDGCEIRIVRRVQLEALAGEIRFTVKADAEYVDLGVSDTTGATTCAALLAAEEGRLKNPVEDPLNGDIKEFHKHGVLDADRVDALLGLGVRYDLTAFSPAAASSSQALSNVEAVPAETAKVLVNEDGAEMYVTAEGLL